MSRRRWPWVLLALLGLGLVVVGQAAAQTPPAVVTGLGSVAQSDGIGSTFGDPNAQPYPVAASQIAHTEATLATGPTGYALASTSWPGPLVGNAGSLAVLLGAPKEAGSANYPVRAEAFSPAGPPEAEQPGMRAAADDHSSTATAGAQDIEGQPGVATGDVRTASRSSFEDGLLTGTSSCTASDIEMADGVVEIGSVHTEASASTDGTTASSAGRTVVSGMFIAGQAAEVDEDGVRFVDPVTAPVGEQVLSQMGMEMFVAAPRSEQGAGRAAYHAGPLVVIWEPPESGQLFTYAICGSDAATSLRLGEGFVPGEPGPSPVPTAPTLGVVGDLGAGDLPDATADPPAVSVPPAPPGPAAIAVTPAAFVRNLSILPYVLGAVCCALAAWGLARGRERVLAPRLIESCSLEGGPS